MRIKPSYDVHIDPDNIEETVERLSDSVRKSLGSIVQSEILAGNLLKDIALGTEPTRVPHKLNRKPLGWLIVDQDANATIYSSKDVKSELFLNLTATSSVTVSIWVF